MTLLFAKFVPGLSTVAAPIAGQTGMPYAAICGVRYGGFVHLGVGLPAGGSFLRRSWRGAVNGSSRCWGTLRWRSLC